MDRRRKAYYATIYECTSGSLDHCANLSGGGWRDGVRINVDPAETIPGSFAR
jgi:hypothetical protein